MSLALLTTAFNNTNAFWVANPREWCNNSAFPCSSYPGSTSATFHSISTDYSDENELSYWKYSNRAYQYVLSNTSVSNGGLYSGNLVSYNDGDYYQYYYVGNSNKDKMSYNFINIVPNGELYDFKWWYDFGKVYKSINAAGFPSYLSEGDFYQYYIPRHANFVFYNKNYLSGLDTIQYIGNQRLHNKIIYVDTLDTDENVWLIDVDKMKAWSMYVDDIDLLSQFLFGGFEFSSGFLQNEARENTYNISLTAGGSSFYPLTDGQFTCQDSYIHSSSSACGGVKTNRSLNIALSYSSTDFVIPDYGVSDDNNIIGSGGNAVDDDAVMTYEKCIDYHKQIQQLAIRQRNCQVSIDNDCNNEFGNATCMSQTDYENMYNYLKITNGTGGYTGQIYGRQCTTYYNRAVELRRSVWTGDNGGEFIRNFLVANYWSVSPNDMDFSARCGDYPNSGNPSSEQTWLCKLTGVGCNDSLGQIFDIFKQNLRIFYEEPINKLTSDFYRGYNYFGSGYQCSSMYGVDKSYPWGNYLLMFVLGRLGFVLYSVFKD